MGPTRAESRDATALCRAPLIAKAGILAQGSEAMILRYSGSVKAFNAVLVQALVPELAVEALWFLSLSDARQIIEQWRRHYNQERPHSALGYRTPEEFAAEVKSGFYRDGVGQGTSTPAPCPTPPSPLRRQRCGANKTRRKSHYPWTKNGGQVRIRPKLQVGIGL